MRAWLLYSFGTLTCWLCWLIILIEDSNIAMFLCFIAIFIWDIDMLIVLIDYLTCLSIVILILPWLFYSLHMHRLTVLYLLTWCVDSLACILSKSSLSMLYLSLFILIVISRMWTWVVYSYFAWLYVTWLPSPCDCMPLVHVGRTSIPLPPTLCFGHFFQFWLSLFASVRPCVCLFL